MKIRYIWEESDITPGRYIVMDKSGKPEDDAMFLASAEGAMQAVAYADIERASYSNASLMPDGYDKILAPGEIADIVAWLNAR